MIRRHFLALLAAARAPSSVQLYIGNYGMQSLDPMAALTAIRKIGYDAAELCLMPGWPTEPSKLDAAMRKRIARQPLPILSMIENFNTLVDEQAHQATLDRIRAAATLAHDLAPQAPPILQSVLGGKPNEWEQVKDKMAARLADWARVAAENKLKLAVKSHIGSASDTPEKLVWLLNKVNNPALSGIYDYGHFQLLNLMLSKSLNTLLPRCSFITLKDGRMVDGKAQFLLPGDGSIDYKEYFALLKQKNYRGPILIEITRQLQTQSGYDPIAAARRSYENIAPLLAAANLR
ncbi:sugar phosphate isomerase/epimerase family protein [Bryobacter aggregatus]|uniref:sugar phosphate isomerase/epimerase family protein n=1 Tax=Bryobacter aggregatus TaxID=360054 RepID=UPI00068FCE39|nr:sugar phosphate isomerase/epimerase [Bryobacter aggregatus]